MSVFLSSNTQEGNGQLFLDSSFHDVDAKLTDMQIFSGKDLPFSVDVSVIYTSVRTISIIT
jgi:hypothetical protein